ncbi:MAG: hypothetical protein MUP98_00265 [Candidatus Aminicenantes bacterium]|nr:hypothetical protein [Candidatus Aminicenantes bacterium]
MQKNQTQKKTNGLIVLLLCLLNIGNTFVCPPAQMQSLWGSEKSPVALIYIIEFRDILCSPCSESFLDFCLSLPPEFQRENTWGIVVFEPASQINLEEKIITKKVRGFMNGNRLQFPVFIDFLQIFKTLRNQATQLLLLDSSTLKVNKYDFPLAEKDKNEIIQAVIESL